MKYQTSPLINISSLKYSRNIDLIWKIHSSISKSEEDWLTHLDEALAISTIAPHNKSDISRMTSTNNKQ